MPKTIILKSPIQRREGEKREMTLSDPIVRDHFEGRIEPSRKMFEAAERAA